MSWKPLGKYVLVELHKRGSTLELSAEVSYNGLATVLAVGPGRLVEDGPLEVGDVVMLNGPQGLIAHKELGEDVALVAGPLVLAKREGAGEES
jgi:co-chaperonin GroES (HSP10)